MCSNTNQIILVEMFKTIFPNNSLYENLLKTQSDFAKVELHEDFLVVNVKPVAKRSNYDFNFFLMFHVLQ
jgi:hypothetical protein